MSFSVLHVLPSLDLARGGPVVAVTELVAGLDAHGIPAAIAVPSSEVRRGGGARLVYCGAWRVPFGPVLRLRSELPLPPPVVVHVHGLASLTPWSPYLSAKGAFPVVGTLHGVLDRRLQVGMGPLRRVWHQRLDLPLLRRLDGVHATRVSEVESALPLRPGLTGPVLLPWGIADTRREAVFSSGGSRSPYFLAVGRLHPIKGLERLMRAFAAAGRPLEGARLLIAGRGSREYVHDLQRLAISLRIRARVELLGAVEPRALRSLYAEASALVLPSVYENFGMVVIEALREGCPVLASRQTPWATLESADAGRWIEFESPEAPRELVACLDPATRRRRGANARALFERHYEISRVVPSFAMWYEAVLASSKRRAA